MDCIIGKLSVYFEGPFWVGVFERHSGGKLSVCRVVFGSEPKDYEVYDFVLRNYDQLPFSPAVASDLKAVRANPKRMQREAAKAMRDTGIGTKSQQALQLQREQMKQERRQESRAQREAEKQRRFELKQQKRKEKHRGR